MPASGLRKPFKVHPFLHVFRVGLARAWPRERLVHTRWDEARTMHASMRGQSIQTGAYSQFV